MSKIPTSIFRVAGLALIIPMYIITGVISIFTGFAQRKHLKK